MYKYKLSICISTRNRSDYIAETLDSIIPQITDQVELIIIDGASTDLTPQILKEYQKKHTSIKYYPQNTNGGLDQDYNKAIEISKGQYCWLMSDDDLIKKNAISIILDELEKNYSLIIVNAEVKNKNLEKLIIKKKINFIENKIYAPSDFESLFLDTINYLSFIGCVIIQKNIWLDRKKEYYFGSLFIHVGVIFQSPLPSNCLVIARPLITIRYGNAFWSDTSFEVWMFKWPNLIWSFNTFQDYIKENVSPKQPWRKVKTLLSQRARGIFNLKMYEKFIRPRLNSYMELFIIRLISIFPIFLINLIALFYYYLLPKKSDTTLYEIIETPQSIIKILKKIGNNNKLSNYQKKKKKTTLDKIFISNTHIT